MVFDRIMVHRGNVYTLDVKSAHTLRTPRDMQKLYYHAALYGMAGWFKEGPRMAAIGEDIEELEVELTPEVVEGPAPAEPSPMAQPAEPAKPEMVPA